MKHCICVDTENIKNESEKKSALMHKKFWNYMAVNAKNDKEGGAWFSSYTGETFTNEEINDFIQNVNIKLSPYINKSKKIFEIGCSSGLTMYSLANLVKRYVALDISNIIIDRNNAKIISEGIDNIELYCLYAHEMKNIQENDFDIGIMNSVVQCFDGHFYLTQIISEMIDKMNDDGIIFIGDVIDAHKRIELQESVEKYWTDHNMTKYVDLEHDLFLSKEFFYDLQIELPQIMSVEINDKYFSIDNELTRYRYDVIIKLNKKNANRSNQSKIKFHFSYNINLEENK